MGKIWVALRTLEGPAPDRGDYRIDSKAGLFIPATEKETKEIHKYVGELIHIGRYAAEEIREAANNSKKKTPFLAKEESNRLLVLAADVSFRGEWLVGGLRLFSGIEDELQMDCGFERFEARVAVSISKKNSDITDVVGKNISEAIGELKRPR